MAELNHNILEARTHLSRIVERVARGESVVIAKAGKPRGKLVPLDAPERGLLDNGYIELPITGEHALATESLPPIRKV